MQFNWKQYTKVYIAFAAFLILAFTFSAGVWYGYQHRPAVDKVLNVAAKYPPPQYKDVDFNLFWDVWSKIDEKYVDKTNIDRQKAVYGAISGLVGSLKDPYTEFFPPSESKQFQQDIKGSFEGIGAEIGIRKSILTIIAPLKGSPAERAGLKAGDKILKIDDKATTDLTLNEAVQRIRGEKGTEVKLTIFRDGFDKTKEFKVVRDTIQITIVETEKKSDGIFVIKLNHFTQNASSEFRKALDEMYHSGSGKLVLDLRNDPGGFLDVAVDIASWFLPSGEVVLRERSADGSEDLYRSQGYRFLEKVPVVVLVNEGSASASEILAGALRDERGIKLIGNKTFGKGSVQEVVPLSGGSSLKVTIAKWLTPKGEEINGKGLEPDIKVDPATEDELAKDPKKDPMMDKAIEVLKGS